MGSCRVDAAFDDSWKGEVDKKVSEYSHSGECGEGGLDREIEIGKCVRKLKNNMCGGSDGLVGELLKYGGSGMIELLHRLLAVIWHQEFVPPQWRKGFIVNLLRKEISPT